MDTLSEDAFAEALREVLFDPVVGQIVFTILGLLLIYVISRFVRRSLARYVADVTARYRARKFVSLVAYLLAILFLGVVFSDRLGGLTVAFGVAGAGIAFALQEVIVSVAGWLTVTFGNFYRTGDRVMLGGIKGDVIDIGVLRTTVFEVGEWVDGDLYNGRVVRIANSFVFKDPVFNYSGDFPFLWDELVIPIRHGSDRARVRRILNDAAQAIIGDYIPQATATWEKLKRKYMIEAAQVEPMVSMTMDENWMTYTLRYPVEYKRRRAAKTALYEHILEDIEASGGAVSIASTAQEITLIQGTNGA